MWLTTLEEARPRNKMTPCFTIRVTIFLLPSFIGSMFSFPTLSHRIYSFTPLDDSDEVGRKSHLRHEETEFLVFLVRDQGQIQANA